MYGNKQDKLTKLFNNFKKGSKEFRDESTKPHVETLSGYASQCKIVTELGINTGCATLAFILSGCKKVYSYNVVISQNAIKVKQAAEDDGFCFKLINKDNLKTKIKSTDLLYIDTDHWYGQIKAELSRHHKRVKKWIIMNNTETFGLVNPFDGRPGMKAAIYEFLEENPEWKVQDHLIEGHGLTILERKEFRKGIWQIFNKKKSSEENIEAHTEFF
jgi:hypothetical protein